MHGFIYTSNEYAYVLTMFCLIFQKILHTSLYQVSFYKINYDHLQFYLIIICFKSFMIYVIFSNKIILKPIVEEILAPYYKVLPSCIIFYII